MNVRRILFATDGSAAALEAANKIAFLVRNNQETSVTVVAALPPGPDLPANPGAGSEAERETILRGKAKRAVDKTAGVFAAWGLPWDGRVVEGDCACTAIARAAEDDLSDLIVMSSTERLFDCVGQPADVNLTDEVMQRATVPVLVIPPNIPAVH